MQLRYNQTKAASWRPNISMVRQERVERYASTVSATSIDSARPLIYKPFSLFSVSLGAYLVSEARN